MKRFRLGLAVSGGADSTALVALLAPLRNTLNFTAHILHVDHGLRSDSGADAQFVKMLARRYHMPFHLLATHVRKNRGESIEMAARRIRLKFFARMMRELHLDAIATGHHADDVAETFLMRLARGSSPEGLAGLKPISQVDGITFIRPLLTLRDAALKDYLRARGLTWREDSTNGDTTILRNRVRHVILPFLTRELDAHLVEHILKTTQIMRGELVKPTVPACAPRVTDLPQPRYALRIAETCGFEPVRETPGILPATAFLSRAALAGRTLRLRPWQAGDRMAPLGMGGKTRKVQDIFVTAKVPRDLRAVLPLLTDAQTGEVLWVPTCGIAEPMRVSTRTASAWRLTLEVIP